MSAEVAWISRLCAGLLMLLVFALEAHPQSLTPKLIDQLVTEGNCTAPGIEGAYEYYDYDVAAYERYHRIDTPFGRFQNWDHATPRPVKFSLQPQYAGESGYTFALTGFYRGREMGPDQVGRLLADHRLACTDCVGNGLYEQLLICKKYGIRKFFYAPDEYSRLPYLDSEVEPFREAYRETVASMARWLDRLSDFTGVKYRREADQLWSLLTTYDGEPLDLFLERYKRDPDALRAEFRQTFGYDIPLDVELADSRRKARRIQFWFWLHDKFARINRLKAESFRELIVGPGELAGNVHFETIVDYERWGEAFDHPGFAPRPNLLDTELGREYYVGYATRLVSDLCDKAPRMCVRSNLLAAGSRFVPTSRALRFWYSQAIQNGAHGFYEWHNDFAANVKEPGCYSGPLAFNPDASTLPKDRWRTTLEVCKQLRTARVFKPPEAETAIFVPLYTCMLEGWKRVFSAYIELCRAGVWSNFVSDQELWEGGETLGKYKVVYVPILRFEKRSVLDQLVRYVQDGGTLVIGDPRCFEHDGQGEDAASFRRKLCGVVQLREPFRPVRLTAYPIQLAKAPLRFYSEPHAAELADTVQVIARFAGGEPALVKNQVGAGAVYTSLAPLMDIYEHKRLAYDQFDSGRDQFYKAIEKSLSIEDKSWIWSVTTDNVHQITGSVADKPQPVDETVVFSSFMYDHGDLTAWPWLYRPPE